MPRGGPMRIVSYQSGKPSLRLETHNQFSGIQESVLDQRNVVVITFCADLKEEKAFLLNCLILWLHYTYPSEDVEHVIGDWRKNPPPELLKDLFFSPSNEPGIWLCPKLWTMKNGDEKIGILLMDCSTSAAGMIGTISYLGAVCSQISSVLVYIAKNELDHEVANRFQEFVNIAIALSFRGAVEGKKMFQKVTFVVTDSAADWGECVGQKQLDRFLTKTCEESKLLFKDFHFSRLFDDIECVYMPKSGVEHLFEEIKFHKLISVVSEEFRTAMGILGHRITGPNNLVEKKIHSGSCKPTELLNFLLAGVVRSVNLFMELPESDRMDPLVLANAQRIVENEKILIAVGKIYGSHMSQYFIENSGFREWDELTQKHNEFVAATVEFLKIQISEEFDKERHNALEKQLVSRLKTTFSEIQKFNRARYSYFRHLKGVKGAVTFCIATGLLLTAFSYAAENLLNNSFLGLALFFIGKTLLLSGLPYVLLTQLF